MGSKEHVCCKEFKSAIAETDPMLNLLTNIAEENNNMEFELVAVPVNGESENDINSDTPGFGFLTNFCDQPKFKLSAKIWCMYFASQQNSAGP